MRKTRISCAFMGALSLMVTATAGTTPISVVQVAAPAVGGVGSEIVVRGEGFDENTIVFLYAPVGSFARGGKAPRLEVVSQTATEIRVRVLRATAGRYDVQVTAGPDGGQVFDAGSFTIAAPRIARLGLSRDAKGRALLAAEGSEFGTQRGTVRLDGRRLRVVEWDGSRALARAPRKLAPGAYDVEVESASGATQVSCGVVVATPMDKERAPLPGVPNLQREGEAFVWTPEYGPFGTTGDKPFECRCNPIAQTFSVSVQVPESDQGPRTDGLYIAVNSGAYPNRGELAEAYLDLTGPDPVVTVYALNSAHAATSWFDGSDRADRQWPDRIVSSIENPAILRDVVDRRGDGFRTIGFTLDTSKIIDHAPVYPSSAETPVWAGFEFGSSIGVWLGATTGTSTSYDSDGWLSNFTFQNAQIADIYGTTTPTTEPVPPDPTDLPLSPTPVVTTGTDAGETIAGSDGDDTIDAGDGANVVVAGGGNDAISAGDGDDLVTVGGGDAQTVVGTGEGRDEVRVTRGDGSATIDAGGDSDVVRVVPGAGAVAIDGGAGEFDSLVLACEAGRKDWIDRAFTLELEVGAPSAELLSRLTLTPGTRGTLRCASGGTIEFANVERITW